MKKYCVKMYDECGIKVAELKEDDPVVLNDKFKGVLRKIL